MCNRRACCPQCSCADLVDDGAACCRACEQAGCEFCGGVCEAFCAGLSSRRGRGRCSLDLDSACAAMACLGNAAADGAHGLGRLLDSLFALVHTALKVLMLLGTLLLVVWASRVVSPRVVFGVVRDGVGSVVGAAGETLAEALADNNSSSR